MGRMEYLAMKTDPEPTQLINSDLNDLKIAAKNLINHASKLGSLGFGTSFLKWVASFSAIYLLILDRTNWRTNMLTSLLVPYIFFSLPPVLFNLLRGEVGKWIAFIAIVLRLFFPRHFPGIFSMHGSMSTDYVNFLTGDADWLEMPGSLILLLVVAPNFFAHTLRGSFDRHCNLSSHWLLPAPRAHPGIRWLQEFLHKEPWNIQHSWNYPFVSLPCLGSGSPLPLGICPC
ncbi:Cold-regulated 413 plasma membrane protein 2 [Vitis vinifera]|uniref:Cold-regulated 413 plasma membrane protein 2 n=1 Tax=Vitis vinifera TaxID=29760 RepID=A0A438KR53_VITVI|nr:Cold-regulated 413 plasma membrane protein 2 [Vitis vinifera]